MKTIYLIVALLLIQSTGISQQKMNWEKFQKALKPGEVAIELIRFAPSKKQVTYIALIVTPKSQQPLSVLLKNGKDLETKAIKQYLQTYGKDAQSYRLFWQSIHNKLVQAYPAVKKVYVSLDGIFHRVNLETLQIPATRQFVFDLYDIHRVSSTKAILDRLKPKPTITPKKHPVLVGIPVFDSLPPINIKRKTKDSLQKPAAIGYIHMATHGYPMSTDSLKKLLNSRKGLLKDSSWNLKEIKADSILANFEARNLSFQQTELVVLSADETGLGKSIPGEGVYGLTRAFRLGGAKYVIASLWKINRAATLQLMTDFYRYLPQTPGGNGYHQAWRKAKLKLRKQYPDPKDWGAFVLFE